MPALVIVGLLTSAVFSETSQELVEAGGDGAEHKPHYATSGLTESEASALAPTLLAHITTSRCFLDGNLKLKDLSRALHITEYQTSQVISTGLKENFFSLINRFRIEEAKGRLTSLPAENRKILEIAYGVGFNSKSAFNSAFRKLVGVTPSEFRRRQAPVQ